MNGRFSSAIVAFAVAAAVATHASVLPEFLVQLRDPNVLGGALFTWCLHVAGYAFVLAMSGALSGAAVLLVAWRTRLRGASDWHAALAAVLAALCMAGRFGVSLDPIGWVCLAALCLLLDRNRRADAGTALGIVAIWAMLQGGATLGALVAILYALGGAIDAGTRDPGVRRRALVAAGACAIGLLQLHAWPWHAYGAHALYLDSLVPGAQRDRIWNGAFAVPALGFAAVLVVAAWYGVRRRAQSADALVFFGLFALSLADARNLPYFGIAASPIVADTVASYYVNRRTFPAGSTRSYAATFLAAAAAFAATLVVSEPKAVHWPHAPGTAAALAYELNADGRAHVVLCTLPRWCDGLLGEPRIADVMDDRGGVTPAASHRTEYDVATVRGAWRSELRRLGVDSIITSHDDSLVALLVSTGWHVDARDGGRVLMERERP